LAVTDSTPADDERRTFIGVSATLALIGIALSTVDAQTIGGWLAVGALVVLIWSLHRFGRTGPDEPSLGDDAE
jgi:hypothetical protein